MGSNQQNAPFNWAREIGKARRKPDEYIETQFWKGAKQNLPPYAFRETPNKGKNGNARTPFATSQPERIFRVKEDAEYDDRIRTRIKEESELQGQRAALQSYYRMRGRLPYMKLIQPLQGPLRQLADSVAKKMKDVVVEGESVKFSQNVFQVIDAELKKIKKRQRTQALEVLPRGIAATHAGMVSAEWVQVPRGSDSLFSAVAQALSFRHQGIFIADPKRLAQSSRRLRNQVRDVQCKTQQVYFEGALNKNHCQQIAKPETYKKTINGGVRIEPGTYGGETEILALALLAKTTIAVFSPTPKTGIYTRVVPHRLYGVNTKEPPIFLLRKLGSSKDPEATAHYDVLFKVKPMQQLPSVQMIKSAREMMNVANALRGTNQSAKAPSVPPQPIQVVVTPSEQTGGKKESGGLGGLLDVGSFIGGDIAAIGTLAVSCIIGAVQAMRR